jgi:hypothetical protein
MIKYAVSHEVEQFKVGTYLRDKENNMLPFHSIFYHHSLKCLDLTFRTYGKVKFPEIVHLPELVEGHLKHVAITSTMIVRLMLFKKNTVVAKRFILKIFPIADLSHQN